MVWRWNGTGFLPGVPERDIEETEAEELGIAALLAAAPAYTLEEDAEAADAAATDDAAAEEDAPAPEDGPAPDADAEEVP